jgi:hypothetical protein
MNQLPRRYARLRIRHCHKVDFDQEVGVPEPGNANEGARWGAVGVPRVRHGRVGLHLNEGVHVEDEDAPVDHIVPGSTRRPKLDRQRFHHP